MKRIFLNLLRSGLRPELSEEMRVAIQVANADVMLTILTLGIYSFGALTGPPSPLSFIHPTGLVLAVVGYLLIRNYRYDLGRFLIHFNGLAMIFCPADMYGRSSGFPFYYLISLTIPYVTFGFSEYRKAVFLSTLAGVTMVTQEFLGDHVFFKAVTPPEGIRIEAVIMVLIYFIAIYTVVRFQIAGAQRKIVRQQKELLLQSDLLTIGEITAGIAHEINNPLQSLLLQNELLRRELRKEKIGTPKIEKTLSEMDATGLRVGKMVKGLKDLSSNYSLQSPEIFDAVDIISEVLKGHEKSLADHTIRLEVAQGSNLRIKGNRMQFVTVVANLIENAIDALIHLTGEERTIWIESSSDGKNLVFSVTNSGPLIPDSVAEKMMRPFFTTKEPSKVSGLGLAIASSLVGKSGGRLYYDQKSLRTRFVVEYPLV